MRNTPRSFYFLFTFILMLGFAVSGCVLFPGLAVDDDDAADDDDSADTPANDDDAVNDDDASDDEPEGAPCFGREPTEEDFDCDGVPDLSDNPDEDDVFFYDPNSPRFIWRDSIASDSDELRQVGLGHGTVDEDGWLWENGQPVLRKGGFLITMVSPGIYRVNVIDEEGNWGQFGNYCQDGVWLDNGDWIRDPACMYDAGCAAQDIPPGWAMTGKATEDYTRRLTPSERDEVPLAEDDCPTAT